MMIPPLMWIAFGGRRKHVEDEEEATGESSANHYQNSEVAVHQGQDIFELPKPLLNWKRRTFATPTSLEIGFANAKGVAGRSKVLGDVVETRGNIRRCPSFETAYNRRRESMVCGSDKTHRRTRTPAVNAKQVEVSEKFEIG